MKTTALSNRDRADGMFFGLQVLLETKSSVNPAEKLIPMHTPEKHK